jgi:tetratricopeptide (TPR) repeat protein
MRVQTTRATTLRTLLAALILGATAAHAQQPALAPALRDAYRLDAEGRTSDARVILQQIADTASTPRARAAANRAIAMSYAFDGDCANTAKYEEMVTAFWRTREAEEPQNAFYQQGEMANEAARVCIDAGQLDMAERLYRAGTQLGLKEPEPRTHPKSLWDFRLSHALARLAARRGNTAEAARQVAEARRLLDADPKMAEQQERYYPYLTGYVALYTGDLARAESDLRRAIQGSATEPLMGNATDPFMHALLGMTYERKGDLLKAGALYERAYQLSTAHNPPSAFARPFARRKLGSVSADSMKAPVRP